MSNQRTLASSASLTGSALHTGENVTLTLLPAPVGHGFKFQRVDLPDEPIVEAAAIHVKTVERATTLVQGAVKIHTVEHVISALVGLGVDNALIQMNANEPPIGDGSASEYVALIKKAGIVEQDAPRRFLDIREPLTVELNGSTLVLLPDTKFRVSCTQVGPEGRFTQFLSAEITPEFSISSLIKPSRLTLVVIIFSGVLLATSSISIPPSALEIKAILELALSTKHDK